MSKLTFTKTTTTKTSEIYASVTRVEVKVYDSSFEGYKSLIAHSVVTITEMKDNLKDCFKPGTEIKVSNGDKIFPFVTTLGRFSLGKGVVITTYRAVRDKEVTMKKKYSLVVNNYQKGKYLPLFEDYILSVEKIDRIHHRVTFKVNDFEKQKIEKCFNRELQPC